MPEVPKPLAPVGARPYLHYMIQNWMDQGIDDLVFLLHHQAELIQRFLNSIRKEGELKGCRFRTLTESQPLGTGGAVAYAVQQLRLSGGVLVANADTWLGSGIREILGTPHPALAVVEVKNAERYGGVLIEEKKVVAFKEKHISSGAAWINAGLYHLHTDMFTDWDGLPLSLEQDVFPELAKSVQLNAVPLDTDFIDIGIPSDYHRFCCWIKAGKLGAL